LGGFSSKWIQSVAQGVLREEKCQKEGDLGIVLVDDKKIIELNRRYLKRKSPTDVLTFPYNEEGEEAVWGEIYISVERADDQAKHYGVTLAEELARLIIHGVLHLLGYRDDTKRARKEMIQKEDGYLLKLVSR